MTETEPGRTQASRIRERLRRWGRALERGLAVIGLLFVIYHLGFDLSVMASGSMAPTLQGTSMENGDWVLTERLTYRIREPARWEVMTFHSPEGIRIMKRVVAFPGETLRLQDGQVWIDDAPAERPPAIADIEYFAFGNLHEGRPFTCARGYYVLGDDSRDSDDSRFEGPVPPERVYGRAWLILWPWNRIGPVNP